MFHYHNKNTFLAHILMLSGDGEKSLNKQYSDVMLGQLCRPGNNIQTGISGENSRVGFHNFALKFAIKYFIIPPFLHQQKISIRQEGL